MTSIDLPPGLERFRAKLEATIKPHREDCFALTFKLKYAPISDCDYKFEELIGTEIWDVFKENNYLWLEYRRKFGQGHRLGGYPHFSQDDPREFLTEEEQYILLLQIDSDFYQSNSINIQWGI
ncbi:MAG: DUF1963 domain-containing protein [Hydrococcus sp. C42_A2020_068]|nr:DUF1963 domain-containing protein [Pleurocapsa sp. PCC 7327]MBF2021310.1 DUF1963 domain-containing protein [Hydrococcus sp. C42_A2020_068]